MTQRTCTIQMLLLCTAVGAYATEHMFSVAPTLSYMRWDTATQTYPEGTWNSGHYQTGAMLGWTMAPRPFVFTTMQAILSSTTHVSDESNTYALSTREYQLSAGFRHLYNHYETRLWWGISVRNTRSTSPLFPDNYNLVNPSFGVSYGLHSQTQPISWHWGLMFTPGYYNYQASPVLQLPNRTQTFIALVWHNL